MTYPSVVGCLSAVLVNIAKPEEERLVGFGLKAATSFRVEQVSEWNCVRHIRNIVVYREKNWLPFYTRYRCVQ
jgi:hypothetical protein